MTNAEMPAGPTLRAGGATRKISQIGMILAATLLAGWLISGIIDEREERQTGLLDEFKQSWGPEQVVHAPILVVPYHVTAEHPRQYLKIAPTTLTSDTTLSPEQKRRGLFATTVYGAAITMKGSFTIPSAEKMAKLVEPSGTIKWEDSFVMLETSALVGMTAQDRFQWNDTALPWRNCREMVSRDDDCASTVLAARPQMKPTSGVDAAVNFQAALTLRGTGSYRQILEGKQSTATVAAPWPNPSFSGTMLPSASTVNAEGFEGRWQAVEYSAQQVWSSPKVSDSNSLRRGPSIGVELLDATPTYRMIHRASKYGILVVVLSFTTYFLFEMLSGIRIHAIQYGMLGLSLTLFSLLLLSFAEPLGYGAGYAISSGMVLMQASLYTAAVARRVMPALVFAGMLSCLFGFLYVLFSLESYALLVGSLALFVVLSAIMTLTQRVNWWGHKA